MALVTSGCIDGPNHLCLQDGDGYAIGSIEGKVIHPPPCRASRAFEVQAAGRSLLCPRTEWGLFKKHLAVLRGLADGERGAGRGGWC